MVANRNDVATRNRLLEAAGELFAEKGFRAATVAQICARASANIAAVNYYFRSKEALYRQAWQHAHQAMVAAYPPDGGVSPDAPPGRRLRGRIRAMLQRAMAPDALEFRIMSHEIANPTGLLEQVVQDTIAPLRQATEGIIRQLLGPRATPADVRLCTTSVIGPCLHINRKRRMRGPLGQDYGDGAGLLDRMTDHFAAFALAGIRETRRRICGRRGGPAAPSQTPDDKATQEGSELT